MVAASIVAKDPVGLVDQADHLPYPSDLRSRLRHDMLNCRRGA